MHASIVCVGGRLQLQGREGGATYYSCMCLRWVQCRIFCELISINTIKILCTHLLPVKVPAKNKVYVVVCVIKLCPAKGFHIPWSLMTYALAL